MGLNQSARAFHTVMTYLSFSFHILPILISHLFPDCTWLLLYLLSETYWHGWKRSCPKGNSSALPLTTIFEHLKNMLLWQMLFLLWKSSITEWDTCGDVINSIGKFCTKGKEALAQKHRIISRFVWFRCEVVVPWLRKSFPWEMPGSKHLLHFHAAVDYCRQKDTLQKSGLPLAPQGMLV